MNIETIKAAQQTTQQTTQSQANKSGAASEDDAKFSDELKTLSANAEEKEKTTEETKQVAENKEEITKEKTAENPAEEVAVSEVDKESENAQDPAEAIDGLEGMVEKMNKFNRTDEKPDDMLKQSRFSDEKKNKREELTLIDNNMNIQEPKERLSADLNSNMSFNQDGKPFSEFVNIENEKQVLRVSEKEAAEEKAILSTMEENIAIANKNMAMQELSKTKTVTNEQGIKKVDKHTNITVDTVASFDTVVMDKSDVEFFTNLVNGDVMNLNEVKNAEKSAHVSKTLADLLAKSMENNKPIRINFDNDISVIIKVGRDGKISADFLPSSQVAEAYLRENLPLLKQRFDDNNIEYNELNQRKQKQDSENRKKGRKDE